MYSAAAQMDETHFKHKNRALYMRLLRRMTVPLRRAFFLRTGEGPRKLTFKERRERSELPGRIRDAETGIAALEVERDELQRSMADPAFYRQAGARVAQGMARSKAVQGEIEDAYRRWDSLEAGLRELEAIEFSAR